MSRPVYEAINYGDNIAELLKPNKQPYYRPVHIDWSIPNQWSLEKAAPVGAHADGNPFLYIFSTPQPASKKQGPLHYVGKTSKICSRFRNHATAKMLQKEFGTILISIGSVDFGRYKTTGDKELEEVEHILIWSLWNDLYNRKGMFLVPGQGRNRGGTWHVINGGHTFGRKMPMEIVHPWILTKPHRLRAAKTELDAG